MHQFPLVLHQGDVSGSAAASARFCWFVASHPTLAGWSQVATTTACSGGSLLASDSFSYRQVEGVTLVSGHFGLATPFLHSDGSGQFDVAAGLQDDAGELLQVQVPLISLLILFIQVFLSFILLICLCLSHLLSCLVFLLFFLCLGFLLLFLLSLHQLLLLHFLPSLFSLFICCFIPFLILCSFISVCFSFFLLLLLPLLHSRLSLYLLFLPLPLYRYQLRLWVWFTLWF